MLKWLAGNVVEFFTFFAGHEALKAWLGDLGQKTIKAHLGGFGEADEVLTLEAFQVAHEILNVTPQECARIGALLKGLTPSQRNKMSNIIGFDEQEIKTDTTEGSGKDTKKISTTQKKNMRGAYLIKFLSELSDDQIMIMLEGTGALRTVHGTIAQYIKNTGSFLSAIDLSALHDLEAAATTRLAATQAKRQARKDDREYRKATFGVLDPRRYW